jgi:phospholipase C
MDTRREFLKKAAMLSAGTGMINALPASIAKAISIDPVAGSTWLDAEHIVFLMQENRSFDHTYGTLQGVRGYNDPRAITLPNKNLVWLQPDKDNNTFAPFHLDIKNTSITWMESLPHGWDNQVDARNKGRYDKWIESKRTGLKEYRHMPLTMGYYTRKDIPFYYSLADAFTVCDHNFCSSLTGTTPNRLFFWSGTIREEQHAASQARVWNSDTDEKNLAGWKTFPERLEENNIPWKIYQNEISVGTPFKDEEDNWLGNFTDNPIEYFKQYNRDLSAKHIDDLQDEQLKKELLEKAKKLTDQEKSINGKAFTTNQNDPKYRTLSSIKYKDGDIEREMSVPAGDVLHQFREDVNNGQLPTVSWLVAPKNYSDHPSSAWFGAWYLSEALDILTKNPEIWKKTIFILTYDENDGYFDHLPPFTAPDPQDKETGFTSSHIHTGVDYVKGEAQQSPGEDARDSSIGLGYRVPMVIASPWSRGGWVNSQVFDHTSSLQFLEKFLFQKTGKEIKETNISDWRRTVCGDLTSVFRPYNGEKIIHPKPVEHDEFVESIHKAKFKNPPSNYKILSTEEIAEANKNPYASEFVPDQEKGIRNSSALPYELYADGKLSADKRSFEVALQCGNKILGKDAIGSPFQVYAPGIFKNEPIHLRSYAVATADTLKDSWRLSDFENNNYHLRVYGPNGFYREFRGNASDPEITVAGSYDKQTGNLILEINNSGLQHIEITDNAYKAKKKELVVSTTTPITIDLSRSYGWYDVSVKLKDHPSFEQRFAGRVETGKPSKTDPFMGRV